MNAGCAPGLASKESQGNTEMVTVCVASHADALRACHTFLSRGGMCNKPLEHLHGMLQFVPTLIKWLQIDWPKSTII